MILRECSFILPGRPEMQSHVTLQETLCLIAGSFTATRGRGGWVAPDGRHVREDVTIYTVAVPYTEDGSEDYCEHKVCEAAIYAMTMLGRECLYWRASDGKVEMITLNPAPDVR